MQQDILRRPNIKKIVLKQSDGNYVIDLYCSKYPSQFSERKDKSFISELKKIKNREVRKMCIAINKKVYEIWDEKKSPKTSINTPKKEETIESMDDTEYTYLKIAGTLLCLFLGMQIMMR